MQLGRPPNVAKTRIEHANKTALRFLTVGKIYAIQEGKKLLPFRNLTCSVQRGEFIIFAWNPLACGQVDVART